MNRLFPQELMAIPQWVACQTVPKTTHPGKTDKLPIAPRTGDIANVIDPQTWGTFAEAEQRRQQDGLPLIGFVLTDADGISIVDLDFDPTADETTRNRHATINRMLLDRVLGQTFCEVSQSGQGVHIICKGKLSAGGRRRRSPVEVYDWGRFIALTGAQIGLQNAVTDQQPFLDWLQRQMEPKDAPAPAPAVNQTESLTDEQLIEKCIRNDALFLYRKQGAALGDHSRSDFAFFLCLFTHGATDAQAERIFCSSRIGEREKYRGKPAKVCTDYIARTISAARRQVPS